MVWLRKYASDMPRNGAGVEFQAEDVLVDPVIGLQWTRLALVKHSHTRLKMSRDCYVGVVALQTDHCTRWGYLDLNAVENIMHIRSSSSKYLFGARCECTLGS